MSQVVPEKPLRVVVWSTGTIGRHAIAGIDAHPDLELVGVWVSNPDKHGKDAGVLADLGRELGIPATTDRDELIALAPDAIVHTAMADDRVFECIEDLVSFVEAGIPSQRARLINGSALDVLPRLTDGHYDLVFCDGDKVEYSDYLDEALRLLRPGGVVAFDNALWHDRVADPAQRDAETVAVRELGRTVREHEDLVPVLLPVGDGLLVARKS